MVAMPRAKMFDVAVPLLSLAEQLLLKIAIGKKLDSCSRSVGSSRKKIGNDHPTIAIAIFASLLIVGIQIADIFSALFTCGIAMKFMQYIVENVPIEDDFTTRWGLQKHGSVLLSWY